MEGSLITILWFGFLLGIKHAIEPDHVIAVSTIAAQSRSLWRSALAGVFWGIGHTFTLLVVGVALLLLKTEISDAWANGLEFAVGVMLVVLGVTSLISSGQRQWHVHRHQHDGDTHAHFHSHDQNRTHVHTHRGRYYYLKSTLVGFIHGLAGSAAMFVLTMSRVEGPWQAMLYILIFGAGTVLGMLLFTTLLGVPFVASTRRPRLHGWMTRLTGVVSTVFGVSYMISVIA
ncbi:MAG: hypothetical protein WCC10_09820 [Tumebacillaceae bacterium]